MKQKDIIISIIAISIGICLITLPFFFSTKKVNDTYWDSAVMDGILYAIKH